jgi:hypothetical protein
MMNVMVIYENSTLIMMWKRKRERDEHYLSTEDKVPSSAAGRAEGERTFQCQIAKQLLRELSIYNC